MSSVRRYSVLAVVVTVGLLSPCHASYDDIIDSPMWAKPELPVPPTVSVFPEGAIALWQKALEAPEADTRGQAAQAIALAQRRGVKGLDVTVPSLRAALERTDQHATVRLAAAQALVALDARDAAPALLRAAQSGGGDLRDLVEPTLARWDYPPARATWLDRLRDPATPRGSLVLAVRGLGAVREGQAAERLRELVLEERVPGPVRLEAARSLAEVRTEGLEKDAERLAGETSSSGLVAHLAAAALLRRHRGDEAVRLLQRLARDDQPAVDALAVARLSEIDPQLVLPVLDHVLGSPDAKVRALGVEVLFRLPTEPHLRLLGDRLDDLHPDVRVMARRDLQELAAKKEHRERAIAEATRLLGGPSWRGQEQAAILLAQLDHKPAVGRLLELLESHRPEVMVATGWALRKLDVPATLPRITRYVEDRIGLLVAGGGGEGGSPVEALNYQLSQLNQLLGQQKYAPADAALRPFIPLRSTKPVHPESRSAAIWALGLIYAGQATRDEATRKLAADLEGRLNDHSLPSEDVRVRVMSAVALGRMGAKSTLPSLRVFCAKQQWSSKSVSNACGWAIAELTGEAMAPAEPIRKVQQDWFLVPRD